MIRCRHCRTPFRPRGRAKYCSAECKAIADNAAKRYRRAERKKDRQPGEQGPTLTDDQVAAIEIALEEVRDLEQLVSEQPGGEETPSSPWYEEDPAGWQDAARLTKVPYFYTHYGPDEGDTFEYLHDVLWGSSEDSPDVAIWESWCNDHHLWWRDGFECNHAPGKWQCTDISEEPIAA